MRAVYHLYSADEKMSVDILQQRSPCAPLVCISQLCASRQLYGRAAPPLLKPEKAGSVLADVLSKPASFRSFEK